MRVPRAHSILLSAVSLNSEMLQCIHDTLANCLQDPKSRSILPNHQQLKACFNILLTISISESGLCFS